MKFTAQKQNAFADELEEITQTEKKTDAESRSNLRPDDAYPRQSIVESIEKRNRSDEASGMVIVRMLRKREFRRKTSSTSLM